MSAPEAPVPVECRITIPRSARYYTLGGDQAREAWFVLHGFGQLAAGFVQSFAPVASPRRLLVAPEALNHYYTELRSRKVGATWMTSEDRLTQITDYVRYLDLVADEVLAPRGVERVEVHGFSQGCATAARWVALGEVRPARLVLWGGGLPPDLDLSRGGEALSGVDLTLVIGDRDEYITEKLVQAEVERLDGSGLRYRLRRFQGGHVIPLPILEEMAGPPEGAS